jgi:hypothetical protein
VGDSPRFAVRFDHEAFAEDLSHATAAGRAVGDQQRARIEREGLVSAELLACDAEGRDGTRLGGCAKTYLPQPDGDWGMVLRGERDEDGSPALLCLAFGMRHPSAPWRPSVYQVAHRRLHAAPDDA